MMPGSVWDDIPEEDRGFLAGWYQTIDEVGYGSAQPAGVPPVEAQAAQVVADAETRQTFADKIRAGILWTADMDNLPPRQPLIDGILDIDTLAWLIGKPGNGKSFVALDWAAHVGTGMRWSDRAVTQGTVLYVSPESPAGVRLRWRAWEAAARRDMENVGYIPFPIQANDAKHWTGLMEVAAEIRPVLIIFDTQARMTVGMEENSAADMGVFIDRLERLRTATKACVLVVHHTGKSGGIRGSTAIQGAASTIIHVGKDQGEVTIDADPVHDGKTKDAEAFEPIKMRLCPSGESAVLVSNGSPTPGISAIPEDEGRFWQGLGRWWEERTDEFLSLNQVIGSGDTPGYVTSSSFYRHRDSLVRQGLLEIGGTRNRRLYGLRRRP